MRRWRGRLGRSHAVRLAVVIDLASVLTFQLNPAQVQALQRTIFTICRSIDLESRRPSLSNEERKNLVRESDQLRAVSADLSRQLEALSSH